MISEQLVDLSRLQFAATAMYHFLFVPLTIGLAPLVALMQTVWVVTGNTADFLPTGCRLEDPFR